jgi:tRNA dimethylallyltransferase
MRAAVAAATRAAALTVAKTNFARQRTTTTTTTTTTTRGFLTTTRGGQTRGGGSVVVVARKNQRKPLSAAAVRRRQSEDGVVVVGGGNDDDANNNNNNNRKKRVLVISGPTSVGKSSVAISIAKQLDGEIISADSVQVYRNLNVGSAKLSEEDMQSIRHHGLDLKSPVTEDFDVGEFYELANRWIDDIHERGKVPIVCGGTGMYVKWLTDGKPNVPKSTKESSLRAEKQVQEIRDRYKSSSNANSDNSDADDDAMDATAAWDEAIEYLKQRGDSETAGKLARNDWYRLTRALEILDVSGGKPKGSFQPVKDESKQFHCYALSMNRIDLYRRMDQRVEEMVANGILDEAAYLLREGVKPNTNSASRAIGYAQAIDYLLKCKRERENNSEAAKNRYAALLLEFIEELQRETRMYAKRQFTWLRSEKQFQWIDASEGTEKASARILETFTDIKSNDEVEEINESNNNSSICEVTKEMANELKRYRVELKLFHDESIRNATVERVADIVSRM